VQPLWNYAAMPVTLSIKNVPEDLTEKLKKRAMSHHRSMQGELMAILEEAVTGEQRLTPEDLLREVRGLGLNTPAEAAEMIRKDRDSR